jgi:hypothetical protein
VRSASLLPNEAVVLYCGIGIYDRLRRGVAVEGESKLWRLRLLSFRHIKPDLQRDLYAYRGENFQRRYQNKTLIVSSSAEIVHSTRLTKVTRDDKFYLAVGR